MRCFAGRQPVRFGQQNRKTSGHGRKLCHSGLVPSSCCYLNVRAWLAGMRVMDFMPYALPYLDRVFAAGEGPVSARLLAYAQGWHPTTTEQFLAQDFKVLPAPAAPPLMEGYIKAHVQTLVLTRLPGQFLIGAVHAPSLLRREIGFEIGIVCDETGIVAAELDADPAHHSELCLFLLGMGSLETLRRVLPSVSGR